MSRTPIDISGHLLVAIDVAKSSHEVLLRWPTGKTKRWRVPATHVGLSDLIATLEASQLPVIAALEPTGDYHRLIAFHLIQAGITVQQVSSLAAARLREAMHNSWDKNDRKDARVIMEMILRGMTQIYHDPMVHGTFDAQELSNTYVQISLARTRAMHSLLGHYLPLYFPEMERFFNASRSEWFFRFLLAFPVPSTITNLSLSEFTDAAWGIVGRKVAKERFLAEVYEVATTSIGLPVAASSVAIQSYRLQLSRLLDLTTQREALESQSEVLLAENPQYRALRTLPGVGPIIALIIVSESGDLRRFPHHRQYLHFCGFNLSCSQSGNSQSGHRISKRGNKRLRYAYWLAATVAIRQRENTFRQKFEQYLRSQSDTADTRRKGVIAVAAKIARVAHALIKQGQNYRGYHEATILTTG